MAHHGGAVVAHRHRAGQQRSVERVGQPRRQVATVGPVGQDDHVLGGQHRRQRSRPGGRAEPRLLPRAHLVRHPPELLGGLGGPVADQQGPAPDLGHHLGAPEGQGSGAHRHHGDHSDAPTRLPSITAAWARRGATQSPTRSTITPVPR